MTNTQLSRSINQPSALSTPKVSDGDRLGMTFFLTAFLHGILILGITFSLSPQADEDRKSVV